MHIFTSLVRALKTKIRYAYWSIIPYDYRPNNVWYQLKCYLWKRHSTVKSRYLPHTWCDKVDLIPHTIMEMLSQFIEQECSPGWVDWYCCPKTIEFYGNDWNVRDLMQHIYDWYHQVYIPKSNNNRSVDWYNFAAKHSRTPEEKLENGLIRWLNPIWDSEENKKIGSRLFQRSIKIEAALERQLDEYCITIIRMREYMWT